ncbi:MAG: hypothetical protein OXT74_06350, partial [Candidatus Poribacteria bacterium]|nr:hypothetical protein [Candidatus Poribacteria bacterium]
MGSIDELAGFSRDMVSIICKPTNLRPFVCEGSPFECEAFIVGFNPASEMSVDFWNFWSDSHGFDKCSWFEAYKAERRNRPLKPGKTRRNEISNTRRVIQWVIDEANPTKCLETNIYAKPSESKPDLKRLLKTMSLEERNRITAPFDYLLHQITPKLVVAHDEDAAKYLQAQKLKCDLVCVSHFS